MIAEYRRTELVEEVVLQDELERDERLYAGVFVGVEVYERCERDDCRGLGEGRKVGGHEFLTIKT